MLLCLIPCSIHTCCVFMDVCIVLLLTCFPFCVNVQLQIQCGSAIAPGPRFCKQLNYCAPLVCVPDVLESFAVWRHNQPETKTIPTRRPGSDGPNTPVTMVRPTKRVEFDVFGVCLCQVATVNFPCGTFLIRLIPPSNNRGLLPNPKKIYDLNSSTSISSIESFGTPER